MMEEWARDIKEEMRRGSASLDRRERIMSPEKLVRDVMHRGVVTIGVESSVREAARLLSRFSVHALVVLDEMKEVCGVVTSTDILRSVAGDLVSTTVEQIMTPTIYSIAPTALLQEAAEMMLEHRVHQLIVLKGEPAQRRPVGIVSRSDIVRELAAN